MGCGVGGESVEESASHSEVQPRAGKSLKSVSESLNPWYTSDTVFLTQVPRRERSRPPALRPSLGRWVAGGSGVLGLPPPRRAGVPGPCPMAGAMAGSNAESKRSRRHPAGRARGPRSSPSRLGVRVDDTRDLYLDQTNGMDLEKVLTQSCDIEHSTFSFREV